MYEEVTLELLRRKIEDTRFPFGHGYVVAGLLAGVRISMQNDSFWAFSFCYRYPRFATGIRELAS